MHYCNRDLYEYYGDRAEQLFEFLVSGIGCIRKRDLMTLFNITAVEYHNIARYIRTKNYSVTEENDYVYIKIFKGQTISKRYLNTLGVLTAIYRQNKNKQVIITDCVNGNLFSAKMFIEDMETGKLRTYYVLDTAYITVPFYATQDLILAEMKNGFTVDDRIIVVIYEDTDVDYIDISCPLYFALAVHENDQTYFQFYSNNQLKGEPKE